MNIEDSIHTVKLNGIIFAELSLDYMNKIFHSWCIIMPNRGSHSFLDHIFIITYHGDTLNENKLIDNFYTQNAKLISDITRDSFSFYDYLKIQHSGILFVDCKGSRGGYTPYMSGLHIHCVVVVHPDWRQRFIDAFGGLESVHRLNSTGKQIEVEIGRYSNHGLFIEKVLPSEEDALKTIRYCAKAIMNEKTVFSDREGLYRYLGYFKKSKNRTTKVRGCNDANSIAVKSLPPPGYADR